MSGSTMGGGNGSRATVLLIEHEEGRAAETSAILQGAGYGVIAAADGAAGIRLLSAHDCQAVVCDCELPDMDGLDVCRAISNAPATAHIPVVLTLDSADDVQRQRAAQAGAADVCPRPFEPATLIAILRGQIMVRNQQRQIGELEGLVLTLARAVEDRDHSSGGLSEKVAHWAMQLGTAEGLSDQALTALYKAALLHDIGSLAVPVSVLSKGGRLEPSEYSQIKRHSEVGAELLRSLPGSGELLSAVRHHHERVDGAGYPDGLSATTIPLFARIIAIADAYVAMTSDRPYRPKRSKEEAIAILQQGAGKQWDAELVQRFLQLVAQARGEGQLQSAG